MLQILHTTFESQQGSYASLLDQLEMRYGDQYLQQVYQTELNNKH